MVSVRISAGSAKGRRIGLNKALLKGGQELRPTSSKVREALFNILQAKILGASFLDLYAGAGGVGIEALSRGAAFVVFVESDRVRAQTVQRLLSKFALVERSRVVQAMAREFILKERGEGHAYDIIFLDPPYSSHEYGEILPLIGEGDILADQGSVIAEHGSKTVLPEKIGRLVFIKRYVYGDTALSSFRLERT